MKEQESGWVFEKFEISDVRLVRLVPSDNMDHMLHFLGRSALPLKLDGI